MNIQNQTLVYVFYHGFASKILMGRLLLSNRQIHFQYDTAFLKTGLELSPFKLPLQSGVIKLTDYIFEGMFGIFNDSLPDGWVRFLLDRKLMKAGLKPETLSPLDRLCYVGSNGMGALSFEPENSSSSYHITDDLDEIDNEIQKTINEDDNYVDDLLILGGSSAGARPKVLIKINHEDWLIKFRSSLDPKDIGAIEYAYHLMAKESGLIVPQARLFPSRNGLGFFGVKRFDRVNEQRIHMHTVAGLLHADHRIPSLDYESIMKATLYLTKDVKQCEVQFRNMVFNVLSHNRDDHSKNFSFLMDNYGKWTVSPAYDLTFSSGPAGEHSTMISGEGRNPTKAHLLKLAAICEIKEEKALDIINQVLFATHRWVDFARTNGVSKLETENIEKALKNIRKKSGL